MMYENFNDLGKNNIKTTFSDLTKATGVDGIKDIVKMVLLGGNIRDTTEFITQRRLLSTYAATIDLFADNDGIRATSIQEYLDLVISEFAQAHNDKERMLSLWLLGLTKKGTDNIVRDSQNFNSYKEMFETSFNDTIEDLRTIFGNVTGKIKINEKSIELNWNTLMLICLTLGAQTLTIRGSAKSMNGKLFEKLILGSLIAILGFTFCQNPPKNIVESDKLFWLSNMDENERETDATIVYNGKAISIDIGFIGRGNPEITLDKVTRFNAYKQIAGIKHNMETIIIVDTVGEHSDLFNKAKRVNGTVLQMNNKNWTIEFANAICNKFNIDHKLRHMSSDDLDNYLQNELDIINIDQFISGF